MMSRTLGWPYTVGAGPPGPSLPAPVCSTLTPLLHSPAADKPEATPEQLDEFREAIKCVGLSTSEILYVDWKKVNTGATYGPTPRPREGELSALQH